MDYQNALASEINILIMRAFMNILNIIQNSLREFVNLENL